MDNLFCFNVFIGKKTFISLYGVLLDITKCAYSKLGAESEEIMISKVELLVSCTIRVDVCVDQRDSDHKLIYRGFYSCKGGVIHAGWVSGRITAVYFNCELFIQIT